MFRYCVSGGTADHIADVEKVQGDTTSLLTKVEAITTDSAADELLACELMRGNNLEPIENSMMPNLKLVIRDVTHNARRTVRISNVGAWHGTRVWEFRGQSWRCRPGWLFDHSFVVVGSSSQ